MNYPPVHNTFCILPEDLIKNPILEYERGAVFALLIDFVSRENCDDVLIDEFKILLNEGYTLVFMENFVDELDESISNLRGRYEMLGFQTSLIADVENICAEENLGPVYLFAKLDFHTIAS